MSSRELREKLGLTRSEWARALGVSERTVLRWEDAGADPGGLAVEVMRGIELAIEDGVDVKRAGRIVSMGIGSVVVYGLQRQSRRVR